MPGKVTRRSDGSVTVEDAHILFKNFEGKPDKYNPNGARSFCLVLDDDLAEDLKRDGWNIKYLKPRDDSDTPRPYISVAVSYKFKAPNINLITESKRRRTALEEDTCLTLDWADIATYDLTIEPSRWTVNGNTGIKAYLRTMFAIIREDYLELKYESWGDPPKGLPHREIDAEEWVLEGEVLDEQDGPRAIEGPR
jgi:hypothetical protein